MSSKNDLYQNIFIDPLHPHGGQMGGYPDTGTFGSGYDFVTKDSFVAEKKNTIDTKPFANWQINAIQKAQKNDLLFKNILLKLFKEYAKKHSTLTKQQLKEGWKDWFAAGAIGASAFVGNDIMFSQSINNINKATDKIERTIEQLKSVESEKNNIHTNIETNVFSDRLINYLKTVENSSKVGFKSTTKHGGMWYPHKSVERGNDTIAWGHKITNKEQDTLKNGITPNQAETLLLNDIQKAKQRVYIDLNDMISSGKVRLNKQYFPDGKLHLLPIQEEMLIDYAFNIGTIKKFPKFTQALLDRNKQGMLSEYERKVNINGKLISLGRNKIFKETFLDIF